MELKIEAVVFKGQDAVKISSSEETSYIFAKNNAVWVVQHPRFSDSEKKKVAEEILDSLILFTQTEITKSIQLRDGV